MRIAHRLDVLDQRGCEFPVRERLSISMPAPGPKMHFINGEWFFEWISLRSVFHPLFVSPLICGKISDDRCRFRGPLHGKAKGVGLQLAISPETRFDRVLVRRARTDTGDEDFPHASGSVPHRV